uniref:histone H4 transcription factor-like n=1 Tax=Myxine glutinosa TaxID=7769 RepID=UPI00358E6575
MLKCCICFKLFPSERILKDHLRHHINHHKCPSCGMTCATPSALKNHIKYRHSSDQPFICVLCGHGCKSTNDLERHLQTHSARPPYQCNAASCSYTARSMETVRNHQRKAHQGNCGPRFKCHLCEKIYSRGNVLTFHLMKKHQLQWPAGHHRFRYQADQDGFFRLYLVRYESVELTTQLIEEEDRNLRGREELSCSSSVILQPNMSPDEVGKSGISSQKDTLSGTGVVMKRKICLRRQILGRSGGNGENREKEFENVVDTLRRGRAPFHLVKSTIQHKEDSYKKVNGRFHQTVFLERNGVKFVRIERY